MVIQMKLWVGDGFFPHAAEEEELKGVKQARWRREEENGRERENNNNSDLTKACKAVYAKKKEKKKATSRK